MWNIFNTVILTDNLYELTVYKMQHWERYINKYFIVIISFLLYYNPYV